MIYSGTVHPQLVRVCGALGAACARAVLRGHGVQAARRPARTRGAGRTGRLSTWLPLTTEAARVVLEGWGRTFPSCARRPLPRRPGAHVTAARGAPQGGAGPGFADELTGGSRAGAHFAEQRSEVVVTAQLLPWPPCGRRQRR